MRRNRLAERAQHQRERFGRAAEFGERHRAHRGDRDQHIDESTYQHRTEDADRQIPAGILGFLGRGGNRVEAVRSEEHTSELQSLMRLSYAVFCLKKKKKQYQKLK